MTEAERERMEWSAGEEGWRDGAKIDVVSVVES